MKESTKNTTNSRVYKQLLIRKEYPLYYDEGWSYYPNYRKGYVNKKQILKYQVRMYKTWKYNRKTQWKE